MQSILALLARPKLALTAAAVLALVAVGAAWELNTAPPAQTYAAAVLAPISALGGVTSDLSFTLPGQIAALPITVGTAVTHGAVLARLDQSALVASRAGAAANLASAKAKLAALTTGTRPEQVTIDQTAVTNAQAARRDALRSAYVAADDAVHNKADQFFSNPRTTSPTLALNISDQALENKLEDERSAIEAPLATWGAEVNAAGFISSDPQSDTATAATVLGSVSTFLADAAQALTEASVSTTLSLATLQSYQSNINTARTSVSGAESAITAASTALANAQGVLTLAQAAPTAHDVQAAQAAVDAASAAVEGIDVELGHSVITAPFDGVVTFVNGSLGQTVAAGQVVVSVQSVGGHRDSSLVVPSSSVIESGGQAYVYVESAQGPVETPVSTGIVGNNGTTEIVSGLTAGQRVLTFSTHYYEAR